MKPCAVWLVVYIAIRLCVGNLFVHHTPTEGLGGH